MESEGDDKRKVRKATVEIVGFQVQTGPTVLYIWSCQIAAAYDIAGFTTAL